MLRWDENEMMSIYPGVSRIYTPCCSVHLRFPCISIHPPSLLNNVLGDALGGRDRANLEMHLEARIEWPQRYTSRQWLSDFGDAIGDRDRVNSEMHLQAMIEWFSTYIWMPRLSELRDALQGCDRANLEMHLRAMIERDSRGTWWRSIWREAPQQLRLNSLVDL